MRCITEAELEDILVKHRHWLKQDIFGWEDMRADLRNCDLSRMMLACHNFGFALLDGANLEGTYLKYSNFFMCSMKYANLRNADLEYANLGYADLSNSNLEGADIAGANLIDTKLTEAKGSLIEYRKGKILTEDIIGYKKCLENVIVTLKIPKGAIVFSIKGRKCRTNRAIVTDVKGRDEAFSIYDANRLKYYKGAEFFIEDFNIEYNRECATGIHFFMTREEAEAY